MPQVRERVSTRWGQGAADVATPLRLPRDSAPREATVPPSGNGYCPPVGTLSYQEMLRALGLLLDACGCETAELVLGPRGVSVTAPNWTYRRRWTLRALQSEAARQRAQHRTEPPDAWLLAGLRWCLRPVGALLDARRPGTYTIVAMQDTLRVRSADGFACTLDIHALRRLALDAVSSRASLVAWLDHPADEAAGESPPRPTRRGARSARNGRGRRRHTPGGAAAVAADGARNQDAEYGPHAEEE
jgi:hypothetical protein